MFLLWLLEIASCNRIPTAPHALLKELWKILVFLESIENLILDLGA
jgi:hypothetical protein